MLLNTDQQRIWCPVSFIEVIHHDFYFISFFVDKGAFTLKKIFLKISVLFPIICFSELTQDLMTYQYKAKTKGRNHQRKKLTQTSFQGDSAYGTDWPNENVE